MEMIKRKTVVLGVTGSIAAYKIAGLASMLVKRGYEVYVLMTQNATNFIHPTTFETLTGHKCMVDTFDRNFDYNVEHVALAKRADVLLIAPASANVIAKLVHGIADDMLTTTALACKCKKIIAPAMNTRMFENPILQDNLALCTRYGMEVVMPTTGYLACGDTGSGKMVEPDVLLDHIEREIAFDKDLVGKKILVTAGPTQEAIDPVRYITNHSSGKMGYAIAKIASYRGADVTLVTGKTELSKPRFVKLIEVLSARDMFDAVTQAAPEQHMIIKAAAVADYRPKQVADHKMKKKDGDLSIELERTDDILAYLGQHRTAGQVLCGFAMETENLLENSKIKLEKKNLDLIVANNLKVEGAGFGTDTNVVTILSRDQVVELEKMEKEQIAHEILNRCLQGRSL